MQTGQKISPRYIILKEIKIKMFIHDTNKYNSYVFRRHLRQSQGALHQDLKLTKSREVIHIVLQNSCSGCKPFSFRRLCLK